MELAANAFNKKLLAVPRMYPPCLIFVEISLKPQSYGPAGADRTRKSLRVMRGLLHSPCWVIAASGQSADKLAGDQVSTYPLISRVS